VLTPDEARQEARRVLGDVARGLDPAEQRASDRAALTVEGLCREYMEKAEKGLIIDRRGRAKKMSTVAIDRGRVSRHIVPLLGRKLVAEVKGSDIRAFVRDVIAGKTAMIALKADSKRRTVVTGGPGTATRTMGLLGAIFSYAVQEGLRSDNPVHGVARPAYNKRKVRLDDERYRALGDAIRKAEQTGEVWQATLAIQLLALTGCRRGEVIKLLRDEVDLKGQALRYADTKTGESIRPLGWSACEVARAAMARSNERFVFPSVRKPDFHYRGLPNAWERIVTPVLPDLMPHGLRHAFASVAEDLGYSLPTIGALLGHAGSGVTAGYVHKLDAALIAAADRVSRHVAETLGLFGPGGQVVELPGRLVSTT
jgi:integrase